MNPLTRTEYDAATRIDLQTFIERAFAELNPGTPFSDNWHVEMLAAELQGVLRGETRRLLINMPPRNLKSICTSVAFPAFVLGHDPTRRIMVVSYGLELAEKLARDCRQLMTSSWYRRLFPATRLSPTRTSTGDFETTAGGGRLATSRGGAITGRGADLIIVDDPTKPDEALSETVRQQVKEHLGHTLISRLNDKRRGAMIVVMQRLQEEDLTGLLLAAGGWRHLCLPAIALEDETWTYRTPFGLRRIRRGEGEALHPDREPLSVLGEMRAIQGEYTFAAQYLQRPAPPGGGLIRPDLCPRYGPGEEPHSFDMIADSWDTANKASELSDYSVCVTVGKKGRNFYILGVSRRKMDYPRLKMHVLASRERNRPSRVLIEDSASGQQLLQDLRYDGVDGLVACKPQKDKAMRFMTVSGLFENGQVYLPREAPWLPDYLHELTLFPNGRHDDQVDATSQALNWLKSITGAQGWFDYAAEQYAKRQAERESA